MHLDDRLVVLGTTVAGVVAAVVLTLLLPSSYRADASIALTKQGQPPSDDPALAQSAKASAELFHSRAVADSVVANLRLDESADKLLDRVSFETTAGGSLVRVHAEAGSPDEARRTVQELTEVSTILFNDRFGPGTVAQIWETPHADESRVSPRPARNLSLGALFGALAGAALIQLRRRPARVSPPPVPQAPAPEPVVEPVIEQPAPAVAAAPPPPAPATGPFVMPRLGAWTLADVERLLAEQGPAFPELLDELRIYLESFRDVAEPDGRLPGGVEAVMEDIFRPLIERARPEVRL
jgi:capsular polysaccharide biosynthesis protein